MLLTDFSCTAEPAPETGFISLFGTSRVPFLFEEFQKNIKTILDDPLGGGMDEAFTGKNTVAYEARYLKYLLLKVQEY